MEEDQEIVTRLQRDTANDVIIQNYDYLVGCVNAVAIFPYLVSSGLVDQDFRQRLDGERTEKDKMMALLRELTRSPLECWFKEFIGALSKISQYKIVSENLQKDFAELMEKKLALSATDDGDRRTLLPAKSPANDPVSPSLVINVSGVDEVMKKAMEDAQAGHKAALSELQKVSSHLLEAEKVKVYAEAKMTIMEERVSELRKKLSEATKRSRETEMQKRLFEKAIQSYKDEASETQERMHMEKMQLNESLLRLQSEERVTRERLQNAESERAALETIVADLQAEIDSSREEKEEEVLSLQQQLSDAKTQQQTVEDELKRLWKEMQEKLQRLENTTRQLDELQSNREVELGHLQQQLQKNASRVEALEGELAESKKVKEKLVEELLRVRKELARKTAECTEAITVQQKANEMEKKFLGAQLQAEEKQKELKEVTEKLELVKLESSQHTERQEQHRSQVADLEAQVHRQSELVQKMEAERECAFMETTGLREDVKYSQEKVKVLSKQLQAAKHQMDAMSLAQAGVVRKLTQCESEGKEKGLRIVELADALQRKTDVHEKLQKELTQCKEEGMEKDKCIADLSSTLQSKTEMQWKLKSELNHLEDSQLQLLCKLDVAQRVYSEKATEVANLNKQLEEVQERIVFVMNTSRGEVEDLTKQLNTARSEVARLEAELKDMSAAQVLAVHELTQCKEEGKEKSLRIARLEDALQRAMEEHRRMEAEMTTVEESTDHKIYDKNREIIALQNQLKEMGKVQDQEKKESLHLMQESLDMQQRQQQQQQGQKVPQYQMPYNPPQSNAPYTQPHVPPPIRYPRQGYRSPQRPTPPPAQPPAPPAPVPTTTPRADEGQCPICRKVFPRSQLQGHVNSHFDNCSPQRPTPPSAQSTAPPAPVPAPVPTPTLRSDEGQCPICHRAFPSSQLQGHVNSHFDN